MLILTRRSGEGLVIGDDIRLTVLGIKGNQVRMGIDAPKDVSVHRDEIYVRIQAENSGVLAGKQGSLTDGMTAPPLALGSVAPCFG